MDLGQYISDLLFEHDCVIVPNFGGFVANYAPASVHPTTHTLQPPYKKITFNKQLTNNDGLLANHIAAFERSSFREANKQITAFVDTIEKQLKTGQRVTLNQIGDLYLDPEGNIRFEQDLSTNYHLGSFGLGSLQVSPVVRERYEREKVIDIRTHEQKDRTPVRRLIPYLAAASVILLIGITIGISILSPNTINLAKLVDITSSAKATYELRYDVPELSNVSPENIAFYTFDLPEEQTTLAYSFSDNLPNEGGIIVRVKESKPVNEETPVEAPIKSVAAENRNYHIIAGAFRDLENANRLVKRLKEKGYNSFILEEGYSLKKVSYGGHARREDAIAELDDIIMNLNPNAWLYKKP